MYSRALKQGKENRLKFLKPYKEAFEKAETDKEKAKIIIELLKKKASLLSEEWILFEVIKWMRERKYKDYLLAAFIEETGRKYRPTEKKQIEAIKGFYLIREIDRLKDEHGSIEKACAHLAMRQDNPQTYDGCYPKRSDKSGEGFEEFLRKKYYQYKGLWNKPKFEFFYGENIYEKDGKIIISAGY